jgi:hypothetical protein
MTEQEQAAAHVRITQIDDMFEQSPGWGSLACPVGLRSGEMCGLSWMLRSAQTEPSAPEPSGE